MAWSRNFILTLSVSVAVTGCSLDVTVTKSKAATRDSCDASQGSVIQRLEKRSEKLIPGEYQFEKADYLRRFNNEVILVTQNYIVDSAGVAKNTASVICPSKISSSSVPSALKNIQTHVSSPDRVIINSNGELEMPENFTELGLNMSLERRQVSLEVESPRVTSLAKEGSGKDTIRKAPGLAITPVKDGLVMSIQNKTTGDSGYLFFRLVEATTNIQGETAFPKIRPSPQIPQSKFSSEQCLEKTHFSLGDYPKESVSFSDDCSWVYITGGIPKVEVTSVTWTGDGDGSSCKAFTTAHLKLRVESGEETLLQELHKLNPGIKIFISPMKSANVTYSYRRWHGPSKMTFAPPSIKRDPDNYDRRIFDFSGLVSGTVDLQSTDACKYLSELRNYKTDNQALTNVLLKDFEVKIGSAPR